MLHLVGRRPTSAGNGRSGCEPLLGFVLARYVIPLNLGGCNVSIVVHAYTLQRVLILLNRCERDA